MNGIKRRYSIIVIIIVIYGMFIDKWPIFINDTTALRLPFIFLVSLGILLIIRSVVGKLLKNHIKKENECKEQLGLTNIKFGRLIFVRNLILDCTAILIISGSFVYCIAMNKETTIVRVMLILSICSAFILIGYSIINLWCMQRKNKEKVIK